MTNWFRSPWAYRVLPAALTATVALTIGLALKSAHAQGGINGSDRSIITFKGKNFWPIGLYDYPRGNQAIQNQDVNKFAQIAADGFNTVELFDHDCGWPLGELETCTSADLDLANTYGLAVIDALYSYNYSGATCWLYQSSQTQVGSAMYNQLQALKSKPALLAWEHMDETGVTWANYGTSTPYYFPTNPQFQTDYNFIKQYGGGIPVWYNDGPAYYQNAYYAFSTAQTWSNYSDIYSNDIYPGNGGNIDAVKQQMDWTRWCINNGKPGMIALNAGNNTTDTWGYEARAYMLYTAIIHGARGVMFWNAFALNDTDAAWQSIVSLASQLKVMEPALAGNVTTAYSFYDTYAQSSPSNGITLSSGTSTGANPTIEARCFSNGNAHFLILANTNPTNSITFSVNSVTGWVGKTLYPLKGWGIQYIGTSFTLGAHNAAVYTDYPLPGTYKFVGYASGKALDDTGWGGAGTTLDLWTYSAGANQQWKLSYVSGSMDGSYFTLQCAANNMYASVNGSTTAGAAVKLAAADNASDQQWSLVAGTGSYGPWIVKNRLSGQVMDVTSGSTSNGALIDQWTQTGNGNQLWWVWAP